MAENFSKNVYRLAEQIKQATLSDDYEKLRVLSSLKDTKNFSNQTKPTIIYIAR